MRLKLGEHFSSVYTWLWVMSESTEEQILEYGDVRPPAVDLPVHFHILPSRTSRFWNHHDNSQARGGLI